METKREAKFRNWQAVMYPETMVDDWKDIIGEALQGYPYAYCIHDKDVDKDGVVRKEHVHCIVAFPNPRAKKNVLQMFMKLQLQDKEVKKIEPVQNIRNAYNYLIHDTETCKKQKKFLYSSNERILGNNFDIGAFEQIGVAEKTKALKDLCSYVINNKVSNFADLYAYVMTLDDEAYFDALKSYSGLIERIIKGVYLKRVDDLEVKERMLEDRIRAEREERNRN